MPLFKRKSQEERESKQAFKLAKKAQRAETKEARIANRGKIFDQLGGITDSIVGAIGGGKASAPVSTKEGTAVKSPNQQTLLIAGAGVVVLLIVMMNKKKR